jgi:hypothetical protein
MAHPELVLDALETVIQHAVQMLCDYIDDGNVDASKANRNACVAMLNKLPITCNYTRAVAAGDVRYSAIMFYERTRLGAASSGHFLEGMAKGLSMFTGPTRVVLKDSDLEKLRLKDVVADRVKTVSNLENLKNDEHRLVSLVEDYALSDIASGIPGRVHVFLARMRAICQGVRRVKPVEQTKQCHNRECCRLFYCGSRNEVSAVEATAEDLFGECTLQQDDDYWILAAGGQQQLDRQSEFCTWACYKQWQSQIQQALPDSTEAFLVADYQTRHTGRPRVSEALRLICKRNEQASRHLRIIQKDRKVFPAVAPEELREHRQRRVRALNVDLGLVYAASLLAESKSLSTGKVLAGSAEGWRRRVLFYAKPLKDIGKIYDRVHTGGNVISNLYVSEAFLEKLRVKATRLV